MVRIVIILLALAAASAPAIGQSFDSGERAFRRADYETARSNWEPLAIKGNGAAQNNLGYMYAEGFGLPKDNVRAHAWFTLAAENDDPNAAQNRDQLSKRMSPGEISRSQFMARGFRRQSTK